MFLYRTSCKAYLVCFIAALFSFYDLFQLSLFNSVGTQISTSFHLSSAALGGLSSSYLIANAIGLIPIGVLIDRFSVRYLVMLFLAASVVACFVIASAHSWKIIMGMRFVQGLTSATSLLTCMRMAIRWFDRRANTAIGLMVMFALLGGVFANDVFINIAHNMGWRWAFSLAGLMGLVILCLVIAFLDEMNFSTVIETRLISQLMLAVKNFRHLLLGAYLGLMSLPLFIFAALWGNTFLQKIYGMTEAKAGFTTGLLFTGLMVGSPLVGYIADKIHQLKLIMVIGAMTCFFLVLPFILGMNLTQLDVMMIFFLLGAVGSTQNVAYVYVARLNISSVLSTATSIMSTVENLVGSLGQLLFGWLVHASWQVITGNQLSSALQHNYYDALLIFPAAFILCIVFILFCSAQNEVSLT